MEEKNGENSGSLTLLPDDSLNGDLLQRQQMRQKKYFERGSSTPSPPMSGVHLDKMIPRPS